MAEGKKQRKFGRNWRSSSSKLQVAHTAANKAKRRKAREPAVHKWMEVPRGATRALLRAVKFYGKQPAACVADAPYSYAARLLGDRWAARISALYD